MTIKDLVQGVNAEEQLRIFMVADTMFYRIDIVNVTSSTVGRYYGGQLRASELHQLVKPERVPKGTVPNVTPS